MSESKLTGKLQGNLPEAELDGVSGGTTQTPYFYRAKCKKCGNDVGLGFTKVDEWTCTECGGDCRIYKVL